MKLLIVCSVVVQRPLGMEAISRMKQGRRLSSGDSNCHVINDELSREGGIPGIEGSRKMLTLPILYSFKRRKITRQDSTDISPQIFLSHLECVIFLKLTLFE